MCCPSLRFACSARRALQVIAVAGVLVGSGCGGGESTPPLVASGLELSTNSLSLDAIGATQSFTVVVRDQHGASMPSAVPTLLSSSPAVATVSGGASAIVTAVGNGNATISIAAGAARASVSVTVAQVAATVTAAAGNNQTALVGSAVPIALAARVADRTDHPVPNVSVTFTAGIGSGTITGSPALTDAQGVATVGAWTLGTTPGVKSAAATVSGASFAAFNATAVVGPAASLVVSAGNNQLASLSSPVAVAPSVRVVDAFANPVADVTVTFAVASGGGSATGTSAISNSAGIASVGGWVMGAEPGINTLVASSAGLAPVTFSASAGLAPVVSAVSPGTLIPGSTMTVTGSGFAPTTAGNVLRVGGQTAVVTGAAPTQLTATVPCTTSGAASVTVTAGGFTSNAAAAPVAATTRALAVGQAFIATSSSASLCNELPATGGTARYLVSIFSASTSANSLVDFALTGNAGAASAQLRVIAPQRMRAAIAAGETATARQDREHWSHLEAERALGDALRVRAQAERGAARQRALTALTEPPSVGDRRVFYWNYGSCTDTTRLVTARVLYAGTRAIIWEDTSNAVLAAANATLADRYRRIGQVFDLDQYDVVRTTFGDPLRRDALTDNDARVHMLFTHRVNEIGSVAAYVTSADQYPRTTCATSNFGEFFYGSVPTQAGSNLESTANPEGWYNFMGRTVVHEVKHIASMAARVANGVSFEQSWLEEGTARQAEEVWARQALHHAAWKGNHGYGVASGNGLYCDFNPSNPVCLANDPLRRPSYGVRRQFNEIRPKLLEPWNWSLFGDGAEQSGSVFYQTVWSLVRYAIDLYGTSDAAFLSTLTNATSSGITNLASTAGVPFAELLGGWTLALFADDYPGLTAAGNVLKFQTWNLRDIYGALNADPAWTSRFPTPYPIAPTALTFGAFSAQQTGLRGGANAYFEISGSAAAAQAIGIRSLTGGTPSGLLRIAIARLQ
ncbi:MAG: IPT/TIG domain-containing protein [Gemmatimonadetes bacterium]|nr:IPT/TIG domain-containing protein [Gemmatimonadota bacterium]